MICGSFQKCSSPFCFHICKPSSSSPSWAEHSGRMELCNSPLSHFPECSTCFLPDRAQFPQDRQATIVPRPGPGMGSFDPSTPAKMSRFTGGADIWVGVHVRQGFSNTCNVHACVHAFTHGIHVSSVQVCRLHSCVATVRVCMCVCVCVCVCVFSHVLPCVCEAVLFLHMPGNVC